MLRHEASASYETDASCLSMTEVDKKITVKAGLAELTSREIALLIILFPFKGFYSYSINANAP